MDCSGRARRFCSMKNEVNSAVMRRAVSGSAARRNAEAGQLAVAARSLQKHQLIGSRDPVRFRAIKGKRPAKTERTKPCLPASNAARRPLPLRGRSEVHAQLRPPVPAVLFPRA